MGERIVEGLWDCPYCNSKGIGGLAKHCPCCGHPQDAGTKFYLGEKVEYLEDDLAKQYGQGADWVCAYCGSLNRVHFKYCVNCGAPKDSSEKDYFSKEEKPQEPPQESPQEIQPAKTKKRKRILLPVILLALVALLLFSFWPRNYSATVDAKAWTRLVQVESLQTVQESDWWVPEGGRVYEERTEFSHYVQVLDHYEQRSREVAQQVYDGEDYHTSYQDNGDGTFTEIITSTPRYRTEYHTEYYEQPIYRDDPVYATKYYYDIDKWIVDRTETSSGAEDAPYWPEITLAENERLGVQEDMYTMDLTSGKKSYHLVLPLQQWEMFSKGEEVTITLAGGSLIKINDMDIE